jgi:hypothetical protein
MTTLLAALPEEIHNLIYQKFHTYYVIPEFLEINSQRFPIYREDSEWPNNGCASMCTHMYNTISDLNLWEFMKIDPPKESGYAFWSDPRVLDIGHHPNVMEDGHSIYSFAFIMNIMHCIAKYGWETYLQRFDPTEH